MDEISLDLLDKSPKYENLLPESGNLKSKSGKYRRILEISPESRKNSPESGNFGWKFLNIGRIGFFGFWERKAETDSPELVFGKNDPPPTGDLIGSAGFGSVAGRILRVGRVSDGSGQAYLWVSTSYNLIHIICDYKY